MSNARQPLPPELQQAKERMERAQAAVREAGITIDEQMRKGLIEELRRSTDEYLATLTRITRQAGH